MLSFIKKFILYPFIVVCIILVGWAYGKPYLGKSITDSTAGNYLDQAVTLTTQHSQPVIKFLRPYINQLIPKNYTNSIKEISAQQLSDLIRKTHNQTSAPIILYLYSFNCAACSVNLWDINQIALDYGKQKLIVIAVAVNSTKEQTNKALSGYDSLGFTPLLLKQGEANMLNSLETLIDSNYVKPPYLALITSGMQYVELPDGVGRTNAIRTKISNYIK